MPSLPCGEVLRSDGVFDMDDCAFDRNIIGDFCVAAVNALVMDRKKPVSEDGKLRLHVVDRTNIGQQEIHEATNN